MDESEMNDVDAEAGSSTPDTLPEPERTTAAAVDKERVFIGTGLFWGLVFGVLLAVVVIILAAQNTGNTIVKFLGWDFSTPLIAVILAALLVGVVLDELVGLIYRARRRRTLTDRKELERLQTNS
ncbi:MAG: lipopolysaccharide assembly protein LapA domain-containing protein [Acidimicrobiia bacterium]